jgi:hydrogenase maturation protease
VTDPRPAHTVVLGVGNLLLSDEGVGVHFVQRFEKTYHIPEEIQFLDGGTLGMDLLYYLEGAENLLIIDAVQADREPGTLIRLADDKVPAFLSMKVSPHQVGVPDMLAAATLRGTLPKHIVLWGVQPASLEVSMELSDIVSPLVDVLIEKAIEELKQWGFVLTKLK